MRGIADVASGAIRSHLTCCTVLSQFGVSVCHEDRVAEGTDQTSAVGIATGVGDALTFVVHHVSSDAGDAGVRVVDVAGSAWRVAGKLASSVLILHVSSLTVLADKGQAECAVSVVACLAQVSAVQEVSSHALTALGQIVRIADLTSLNTGNATGRSQRVSLLAEVAGED